MKAPMTNERFKQIRASLLDDSATCRELYDSEEMCELFDEVDRLRAGVERVKALPRLLFVNSNGWMLNRDDVLAALGVSDGD